MHKEQVLEIIKTEKLIAIVRMSEEWGVIKGTLEALAEGGISVIEITTSVPGAVDVVRYLANMPGKKFLVGAGTVLSEHMAASMIDAGAEFVVSPAVVQEVIGACNRAGIAVIPGALTPTEVWRAHNLGADAVKVFPASMFGPSYLEALAGPLPGIRLVPTGSIDASTIGSYLEAGAFAVGVGRGLVDPKAAASGDRETIRSSAASFVEAVHQAAV